MEKIKEQENSLLKRKEVKLIFEAEKTPSYAEAEEIVSKEFGKEKETIAVKEVKGKFGRNTFLISSYLYNSKEDKDKIEPKKKEKKVPGAK